MLDCSDIEAIMARYRSCEETERGTRVATQCLYPSFEQVHVFVVKLGDDFIVHDGGGAASVAWSHGADHTSVARSLGASARSYGCEFQKDEIRVVAGSVDWLWGAIASVANASADAARAAVGKIRIGYEINLIERTKSILDAAAWRPTTKLEVQHVGRSGKVHKFDLGVQHGTSVALIDAIVPHPNSIASKYLAFSDTETQPGLYKYALYDGELAREDKVLMGSVADLISYTAIAGTDGRFLIQ